MRDARRRAVPDEPLPQVARPRIVWLAVAEGRGHLMRAQLAARLLAPAGIDVDIVTTSAAGVAFTAALGVPSTVVSTAYRLHYDERQNLERARTRAMAMRYLVSPRRCARDLAWLERHARGAALVVNDSFHPALLVATLTGVGFAPRVVHVHGANTRRAVEASAGPGPMRALIRRALANAWRIEIVLDQRPPTAARPDALAALGLDRPGAPTPSPDGRVLELPPLLPAPRDREAVRADLGVARGARLAVVYLNPYFHDAALADAIEAALARAGYAMHAVGEGYADRAGWRARDAALCERVGACDLFVSAAGAGALALARASGVPMIALATDQPEQRQNLAATARDGAWRAVVELASDPRAVRGALAAALARVPSTAGNGAAELAVRRARALWLSTLSTLVDQHHPRKDFP